MKTIYISFVCLLFSFFLVSNTFGLDYRVNSNLYNHLFEINKNWQLHQNEVPNELISFHSDRERIQMHLLLVEKSLRNTNSGKRTAQQNQNRETSLDILRTYALAGNFPINTGHKTRQPYFIDNFGTHCAVGFLVKETGFPEISKAISETQNFAYVKEIVSPELVKWSVEYGFTLEELAWIQPTYLPIQTYSQIGQGANGKVTQSYIYGSKWFVSGEFDTLDNLPCLNIGVYENGQLNCLGNGLDGEINDLTYHSTKGLFATGHISHNGNYYPFARFLNNTWAFDSIPNRPNARATASWVQYNIIYIAVDHPSNPDQQEVWKSDNGVWTLTAIVYGKVNKMHYYDGLFGVFDSVDVFENNTWTNLVSKNALVKTNFGDWQTISGIVPDTIFTYTKINYFMYVGGSATEDIGSSGTVVSGILNGIAQPLVTTTDLFPTIKYAVYDIQYKDDYSLYMAGDFRTQWGSYYSKNVGILYPSSASITALGFFDETVYSIGQMGQSLFLAGNFTSNSGGGSSNWYVQDVNRLVKLDSQASISENDALLDKIHISPNPSTGNLNISNINQASIKSIEILDLQGKICHESQTTELDLAHLKSGTYLVRVVATDGSSTTKKWVKE